MNSILIHSRIIYANINLSYKISFKFTNSLVTTISISNWPTYTYFIDITQRQFLYNDNDNDNDTTYFVYIYNHILYMTMRITITRTLLLLLITTLAICSRVNVTKLYSDLLGRNISYQAHSGYQDIDWFVSPSQASIYYSIWECSTKRFSDHSTPVIFYLAGGPGMSSQRSAFREFGPIEIKLKDKVYTATQNVWSWNYYAHVVFVDQPVGVGFSYNKGKPVDNSRTAALHFMNFLSNFLKNFPYGLGANPLYLAGTGYAGHYIPAIFQAINTNQSLGIQFEGVILGGGFVDPEKQINQYQSILSAAGIVSQRQRNTTASWTNQGILRIRNSLYKQVRPFIDNIWSASASQKYYNGMDIHNYKKYTENLQGSDYIGFLNQKKTQLGVPDDVKFQQLNQEINNAFSEDMFISYANNLQYIIKAGKRVLIYNGQNDFLVNTAGVVTYLQSLEWPGVRDWRESKKEIWRESGKITGWVKRYKNLIFVIVKGTGHFVYQDQTAADKSIYLMLNNYFSRKW